MRRNFCKSNTFTFGILLIVALSFFGCDSADINHVEAGKPSKTVEWSLKRDIEHFSYRGVNPIVIADLVTALKTDNYLRFEKSLSEIEVNYSSWLVYYEVNINRGAFNFYFYAFDDSGHCIVGIDKLYSIKTDVRECPNLNRIFVKHFEKDMLVGRDNPIYGISMLKSGSIVQVLSVNPRVSRYGEQNKDITEHIIELFSLQNANEHSLLF